MYKLQLDLYADHDNEVNPEFEFKDFKELTNFMLICFRNGYDVIVKEVE